MRPPASRTIVSSAPKSDELRISCCGKSSASDVPSIGNDSSPGDGMSPQRLSTARNEPVPLDEMRSSFARACDRHEASMLLKTRSPVDARGKAQVVASRSVEAEVNELKCEVSICLNWDLA